MENLFVIYIGGSHEKSFIELHDMRFVISDTIENTYSALKKSWWGKSESLHLDAWGILCWTDGYNISIEKDKNLSEQDKKLYFLNLGGYDSSKFTELHKNIFIVAENDSQAKIKALKQISDWESPHRDYQFEIENITNISKLVGEENYFNQNCAAFYLGRSL